MIFRFSTTTRRGPRSEYTNNGAPVVPMNNISSYGILEMVTFLPARNQTTRAQIRSGRSERSYDDEPIPVVHNTRVPVTYLAAVNYRYASDVIRTLRVVDRLRGTTVGVVHVDL